MSNPRSALLLSVLFVFSVAACGGGQTGSPSPGGGASPGGPPGGSPGAGSPGAGGSIFAFGFSYESSDDEVARSRVEFFREQNPDVDVTFSEGGWNEQQFLSAALSGDPPDVVNVPRHLVGTLVNVGAIQPLGDCLTRADLSMDVFREAAVAQVTIGDQVYALPEFYNNRVVLINNSAVEDAGLTPDDIDTSDWDALAEVNEQLTVNEGRLTRIGFDPKLPEFLPLWVAANGGAMLSEDGTESLLDTPEVAQALKFAAELHEPAGGRSAFMDFRNTWEFFGAENQMVADQLGAFPMEQWYLNILAESSPDVDLTVKPFTTREGEPITLADGNSWAITARTDNVDAACDFITTMVDTETWLHAAETRAAAREEAGLPNTGVYTGNREADAQIFEEIVDLSEFPTFEAAVDAVLEAQEAAFAMPSSPAASAFERAWMSAVDQVLVSGVPVEEALARADAEAQSAICSAAPDAEVCQPVE